MHAQTPHEDSALVFGHFRHAAKKKVVGQFEINLRVAKELQRRWHSQECALVCGTDGGLKDGIGTSGYTIYTNFDKTPLLEGHAAELQTSISASSTRQELLGQLAIEYWLEHMTHTFGEPPGPVQIQLVTDSSASISILEKTTNRVGLKDVMTPDVEIALAILHQRQKTPWTKFTAVKVQSHIDVTDAPDEFLWQVNFHSDRLATEAREKVKQQEMEASPPCLLDGMKVGCFINGNLVYTALKDTVMAHLHSQTMKSYLQNKYMKQTSTA